MNHRFAAHRARLALPAFLVAMLFLGSQPGRAASLLGAWRQLGTPTPPHTFAPVFEFHRNGTVVYDTAGPRSARGRYSVHGSRLDFAGWVNTIMTYSISGNTLKIVARTIVPGSARALPPTVTFWRRLPPFPPRPTRVIGGVPIPADVDQAAKLTYAMVTRHWEHDAYPVSLTVSPYSPGFYKLEIRFDSPSAGKEMILTLTPHTFDPWVVALQERGTKAIPLDFIDLPQALLRARKLGLKGTLKDASLRTWSKFGAAWQLSGNNRMVTLSAATGKPITADVTGTIVRYNAQWKRAASRLRALLKSTQKSADACDPLHNLTACHGSYASPGDQCEIAGGTYDYDSNDRGCYGQQGERIYP